MKDKRSWLTSLGFIVKVKTFVNLGEKINQFENEISGLMSRIDTNSAAISTNIASISANSAAISANMASISTNSENIDTIYDNACFCINGINSLTGEPCSKWAGATLKKLPLWGEQVSDDEINFEWPTPENFA